MVKTQWCTDALSLNSAPTRWRERFKSCQLPRWRQSLRTARHGIGRSTRDSAGIIPAGRSTMSEQPSQHQDEETRAEEQVEKGANQETSPTPGERRTGDQSDME